MVSKNKLRIRYIEGKIQIWDGLRRVGDTNTTFGEQGAITSVCSSPGGRFIATGSEDGSIYLWNTLSGEFIKKLKLCDRVKSVTFSCINEKLIAFGTQNGTVQVGPLTGHEDRVLAVAYPKDGRGSSLVPLITPFVFGAQKLDIYFQHSTGILIG